MKMQFLYKFIKSHVDKSLRSISVRRDLFKNVEILEVLPPAEPSFPALPLNIAVLSQDLQPYFREANKLSSRKLFKLYNVYISWHAVIFRDLAIFCKGLAHPREEKHYNDSYLLKQWFGPRVKSTSDACVGLVHDQWTIQNYYHWMADSLPRLLVLREHYPGCPLVMPEPISGFMRETAEILGFSQLLAVPIQHVLHAKCLLVPQHVAPHGYQDANFMRQLREELTIGLLKHTAPSTPYRRIYVSRSRQSVRRLTNEDEAIRLLIEAQFEVIHFEGMTITEQAKLMTETAILVGVHGANLTNILFMQEKTMAIELINETKLVELDNKDFENLIYYRMSSNLGIQYLSVPCNPTIPNGITNDDDITVNLDKLKNVLTSAIGNKG